MKMMRWILAVVLVIGVVGMAGCKKKSEGVGGAGEVKSVAGGAVADENKPIEQVKAEADKMDVKQLRETALAYKAAGVAKDSEFKKITDEIMKAMSGQSSSQKVTELNAKLAEIGKSTDALSERFQVYVTKLKEKGGDVSGLE